MSSRALRKAQRDREVQDRLKKLQETDDDASEGDDVQPQAAKKSAFALLGDADDEAEDHEDSIEHEQEPGPPSPPKSSAKKNKKKKKGKGAATAAEEPAEQLDEIDKALKELSLSKNGDPSAPAETVAGIDATVEETSKLLAIDSNHLRIENEMRRLFGRNVLEHQDGEEAVPDNIGGNRRQQRMVEQALRQAGVVNMARQRTIFTQGKKEWPNFTAGPLSMEVEERRADGTVLYRYVHKPAYRQVQKQFQTAVQSMDPERLTAVLQYYPYHISTLLQLSEVAKHQRDHEKVGDFLERALFCFGRAVNATFSKTLAAGKARLDFRHPENRELWLAGWRYIQHLSMRGTWRTAYEWAKLLISLSPEDDPYAMWLVLDQYALRAKQNLDYLNLSRNTSMKEVHKNIPGVQISQGLAEFRSGNQGKGKQALYTAFGRFPWVVEKLMKEIGMDLPPAIWGKEPRTMKEQLDATLYVTRAQDIWNIPENRDLLLEIASAIPINTPAAEPNDDEIEMNVARHILSTDGRGLIGLLPRIYTSATRSASDPLPPTDSFSHLGQYTDRTHNQLPVHAYTTDAGDDLVELQNLQDFFRNLFPWFDPDGDVAIPPEEEIALQIENSGVREEVILENQRRLVELQDQMRGFFGAQLPQVLLDGNALPPGNGNAGHEHDEQNGEDLQPRVEDADDAGH